jgi:putative AbiEii toxin of type IV toxin-antitoxin system/AAA ATPase-like protein
MTPRLLPPPTHYRGLSLVNFRGFRKSPRIPLAPLTFLVGPNSSGKSSIFDALLLLGQSTFWPPDIDLKPNWGGPLVDLGSFNDVVFRHEQKRTIQVGVEIAASGRPSAQTVWLLFTVRARDEKDVVGRLTATEIKDATTGVRVRIKYGLRGSITMSALRYTKSWQKAAPPRVFRYPSEFAATVRRALKRTHMPSGHKAGWTRVLSVLTNAQAWIFIDRAQRVSSGRAAPKRWYEVTDQLGHTDHPWGPKRTDAVHPAMVDDTKKDDPYSFHFRRKVRRPDGTIGSVLRELEIADGIKRTQLSPYHSGISVRDNITGVTSHLIDVGYGASQAIPVIHACLYGNDGPLFVEQPEIHLHPRAQGILAELLCRTSRYRQVVVETHSVHMVNRARIKVLQGELRAEDVLINYVRRTARGSEIVSIGLTKDADFDRPWPEGFFDERYEDTMRLMQLKSAPTT